MSTVEDISWMRSCGAANIGQPHDHGLPRWSRAVVGVFHNMRPGRYGPVWLLWPSTLTRAVTWTVAVFHWLTMAAESIEDGERPG
jgi:hypothetical protein